MTNATLNFPTVKIAPGRVVVVETRLGSRSKHVFRGEKIVIVESKAGATDIPLLLIDTIMQFPPPGDDFKNCPQSHFFAPDMLNNGILMHVLYPGEWMRFYVRNNSKKTVKWTAKVYGRKAVDDGTRGQRGTTTVIR